MVTTAVIAAAGSGVRFGRRKTLSKLSGKPLIYYCLSTFNRHPLIDNIIIAASAHDLAAVRRLVKKYSFKKVISVVKGGRTRTDSVRRALKCLPCGCKLVLIHDAVRPFIDSKSITGLIKEAKKSKAAILAVKLKPTIKQVGPVRQVARTIDRDKLLDVQTPQGFDKGLLLKAYRRSGRLKATDDAFLVERLGKKVKVVEGSYFNIKITTPEDVVFAEAILSGRNHLVGGTPR